MNEKNNTFFTSCITRCVTIAKLCESYADLSFVESVDYYEKTLLVALKKHGVCQVTNCMLNVKKHSDLARSLPCRVLLMN